MSERKPYDLRAYNKKLKKRNAELEEENQELRAKLAEMPAMPMYPTVEDPYSKIFGVHVGNDKVIEAQIRLKKSVDNLQIPFWNNLHSVWFYIKWRWHTRKASWRKEK